MNTATATMKMRSILQMGAAAFIAVAGLCAGATGASAQSFLDDKSNGMRRCVNTILNGTKLVKRINVHGHHFNCRPMSRNTTERGNFRQIYLRHSQFGQDDFYYVNFRVDSQNVLLPDTMTIRVVNGISAKRVVKAWFLINPATTYWTIMYLSIKNGFQGPPGTTPLSYANFARLARVIPAREVKKWEYAAYQIAAVVVAEHGRSRTRRPALTTTATQLQR